MAESLKVLFFGDIVGSSGRKRIAEELPKLREEFEPHVVIANVENAAHGFGFTPKIASELQGIGIDAFTGGNHIWDKKEIYQLLEEPHFPLARPANFPSGTPGSGFYVLETGNTRLAIVNMLGRVFMDPMDCPFRAFDAVFEKLDTKLCFVDLHAETTGEKTAFGHYLDGRASVVVGTHTHVQTSDERILEKGTGFITDVGMNGCFDSAIGMKKENVIQRYLTKRPYRMEVAEGPAILQAVFCEIDRDSGKCLSIKRIQRRP